MGSRQLDKPKKMGEKLRLIRRRLDLTQKEMFELLTKHGAKIHAGYIGLYEVGDRLPTLLVTLAYARATNVSCECLMDDEMELPNILSSQSK